MFGYEILRNKWVIASLFIGASLVVITIIYFFDYGIKRKRRKENPEEYEERYLTAWQGIPWSIKTIIVIAFIFAVSYSIYIINNPKSW